MGRCPVRSIFPEALDMLRKKQHLLGSVCQATRRMNTETGETGLCQIR